jgi:predicted lysophospholipase L1 biosynthesis ABC-type transport system permease subunit
MTDVDEARKKPVRTIVAAAVFVFVSLALVDYYLAGTRSLVSALLVGGGAALIVGLVIAGALWPGFFDRALRTHGHTDWQRARFVRRWFYPAMCMAIACALIGYGISAGSGGVAISGLPFLAIAGVVILARRLTHH